MKKVTLLISAASLLVALSSYGAVAQTVVATGNPSTNGWALSGAGGEFTTGAGDWAIFGNGGHQATRSFGDLLIGETVSIDIATLGIANGDFVGVDFQDGATTGIGFNFQGGGLNYNVFDDSGSAATSVGFTTAFQTLTLLNVDDTNYTLSIGATNIASLNLANSTTAIDSIRVFNETSGAGNDVAFNNFTVVPEPGTYALLAGMLALTAVALRRRN